MEEKIGTAEAMPFHATSSAGEIEVLSFHSTHIAGTTSAAPLRSVSSLKSTLSSRIALLLVVLLFGLTGCKTIPPPKPLEQLTAQEQAGHAAFIANCGMCHYDRETGSLHGPPLLGVYKNQYLPSGAPANDERITNTIRNGRGMMPALRGQLSSDDIADILAYLKTL